MLIFLDKIVCIVNRGFVQKCLQDGCSAETKCVVRDMGVFFADIVFIAIKFIGGAAQDGQVDIGNPFLVSGLRLAGVFGSQDKVLDFLSH